MEHHTHDNHSHKHSLACGHTKIKHNGHVDYLHGSHLHHGHEDHWDECKIEVTEENPAECVQVESPCDHNEDCGHELIPHGDHYDYLVDGRLHHKHNGHVDDHGPVEVIG